MTMFRAAVTVVAVLVAAGANAQPLVISRAGSRPVRPAPAQNFTGRAQVERLFEALDPSDASGGSVTFEPGARTAWHAHPRGQILIITAGTGRVQRWGDPIEEVRVGDVVRIPAGQKHWHGASPQASMTHIAIAEHRDGVVVQWMEQVSDEQYNGPLAHAATGAATNAVPRGAQTRQSPSSNAQPGSDRPSRPLQQKVAGMAALTDDVLYGDVWKRPDLSPRDRSLVTIVALAAMGDDEQLEFYLRRGVENGLTRAQIDEAFTHLAFYAGWSKATRAITIAARTLGE